MLKLVCWCSAAVMSCLIELLLQAEPLPPGTVVQEMEKSVVAVLRQLAFEQRFNNVWRWLHKCETLLPGLLEEMAQLICWYEQLRGW
jgi:hypothetical protein